MACCATSSGRSGRHDASALRAYARQGYHDCVIRSFRFRDTRAFFEGKPVRRFESFARVAFRKLAILDAAGCLNDLLIPPGNRLEQLRGDRHGQQSIASTASASTTSSGSALSGQKPGQRRLKSLTTTDLMLVPPGEVLLEEFLRPMEISQYRLAQAIDVPESRINAIVKGQRAITADTDLRLCRFFGLSEDFWLRMQTSHDLKLTKQALASVLPAIKSLQQI